MHGQGLRFNLLGSLFCFMFCYVGAKKLDVYNFLLKLSRLEACLYSSSMKFQYQEPLYLKDFLLMSSLTFGRLASSVDADRVDLVFVSLTNEICVFILSGARPCTHLYT